MLDEIFAVPPPAIFPEAPRPRTVAELAAMAGMGLAEVIARLEALRRMSHEIEIDCEELKGLLDQGQEGMILLDVREDWEFEICKIAGSVRLGALRFEELLPRLKAAPLVVTICHHGMRSYSAAMYLRQNGVPHTRSLAGGVDVWAQDIDPAMKRY